MGSRILRFAPSLLFAIGIGAVALSGVADVLGIGQAGTGFGTKRGLLALVGVGCVLVAFGVKVRGRHTERTGQPPNVLVIALWFGLLTGLGELLYQLFAKVWLNQPNYLGMDFIWMIPAADLVYFSCIGLVLYALNRRWPRVVSAQVATFVCAVLGVGLILFELNRLQSYAVAVLSIGIAVQAARLAASHADRFRQLVHSTLAWPTLLTHTDDSRGFDPKRRELLAGSAVIVAGLALGVQGRRSLAEVVATRKLPEPQPAAPNVLLVVMDTTRAQSLSAYGYDRPTSPQLAQLARSGVLFKQALSTASWTLPSHASMFTGRYAHELSADRWTPLDGAHATLAEVLGARGYATGGFAANTLYCTTEQGLNRGFSHYEDLSVSAGQALVDSEVGRLAIENYALRSSLNYYDLPNRKRAQDINEDFLRWLPSKGARPYFAFLNYFDAHDPYAPPAAFADRFGSARRRDLVGGFISKTDALNRPDKWQLSPDEIAAAHDAYDASLAYMDDQIGRLLSELDRRGELKNTLVVVSADHGEHFGEHGLYIHGNSLYLPLLHVPLVMSLPDRLPSGRQFDGFVSLRDLPATILDVLGFGKQASLPGNSLARFWAEQGTAAASGASPLLSEVSAFEFRYMPDFWPVGRGSMKSLVMENYHYIKNTGSGAEELYDVINDPLEEHDLAPSGLGKRIIGDYRASLASTLTTA